MSATEALYHTLQAQATLDQTAATTADTRALAQMRQLGVMMQMQQMQRDQALRQKLQSDASFPGAPPDNGNPPPPTKSLFGIDFDSGDPMIKSLQNAQQGVDLASQRVALTKSVGDFKGWADASKDWDNQQKEYRLAQMDVVKEGERRNREAAQAFGSVETPEDLKAALQYVNDNVSKKQAQAIATQLAKSLPNPDTATPEQIQAAVSPITGRYTTMGEQLRFRGSMQASADRAATLEQRHIEAEQKAARSQQGLTDLSEGAINDAADVYNSTGKLPPMYRDAASRGAIMNRANERKEAGVTLPAAQAEFKSNSVALNSLTKDIATIRPYKDMLDTNAEILKSLAQKAVATGSPLVNKPINWIEKNAAGDPDMAEFLAQMHFVQSEAARVIQNPRLVGPMTDTAKQEINAVINGDMSLSQVERVVSRIQADGNNRVNAMEKERDSLLKSMTKRDGGTKPAAPQSAAPQQAVDYLKANPALKDQFKAKYGYLPPGM